MTYLKSNDYFLNNTFKYSSIAIILLPWLIISGPFLPDLVVSLTAIFCIIYIFYKKEFNYFNDKIFILFVIFWVYLLLRSLTSINILLSLESSLFLIRFGVFYIFINLLINKDELFVKKFTYSLILCFSVVALDAYIQFFLGKNILGFTYQGERLSGFFGENLILGSYLSRLFPFFFALVLINFSKNFYIYLYSLLLLILADLIIYLTGERVAFFYLFLSTLLIIILCKKWIKVRFFTFIISLLIIFIITSQNENVKKRMVNLTINQMTNSTPVKENSSIQDTFFTKYNVFSDEHEKIYITSINIFKENVIFGVGPKLFREYCKQDKFFKIGGCTSHSHNFYIQLLTETGVIGFLTIFSLFLYISLKLTKQFFYKFIFKKNYLNDFKICILIACFINLFPIAPHGNIFNNWLNIVMILPFCFYNYKNHIND